MAKKKQWVSLDGRKLAISNLEKILYPEKAISKAQFIQYYLEIATHFVAFANRRPITMIRYPDGILKEKFYTKNLPDFAPDFIQSRAYSDDDLAYPVMDSRATLVWMANLASLEMHADNIRFEKKKYIVDHVIFDLDPPSDYHFNDLKILALDLMEYLDSLGMSPFIKTSGSKGFHIYVPIEEIPFSEAFFDKLKRLSEQVVKRFPERATLAFRKNKRSNKVFIDILRNRLVQTCVLPFSTRALPGAPVSMPLFLDDIKKLDSSRDYNIFNAKKYIEEQGNPWKAFDDKACDFFGSGPKGKRKVLLPDVSPDWFTIPSFKHQLASEVLELKGNMSSKIFENKWDGIRTFIYVNRGEVKIQSRNNRDITQQFKDVAKVFENLSDDCYVFDAEIVSSDKSGKPVFAQVVSRLHQNHTSKPKYPAAAYVFDIVVNKGKICTSLPWSERRKGLNEAKFVFPSMLLSEVFVDGNSLMTAVTSMGMEGIMMKDKTATYSLGQRTSAWEKLKVRHQVDCFLIGYTKGSGDRSPYFGSLHVAEEIDGELIYRGKVGTGWTHDQLADLFTEISTFSKQKELPFPDAKDPDESTWFAKPYRPCIIKYASLTSTKTFREPVFISLGNSIDTEE